MKGMKQRRFREDVLLYENEIKHIRSKSVGYYREPTPKRYSSLYSENTTLQCSDRKADLLFFPVHLRGYIFYVLRSPFVVKCDPGHGTLANSVARKKGGLYVA